MTVQAIDRFSIDADEAASTVFDAVIIGSGVSGALIAKSLAAQGLKVLVVEAGSGNDITVSDYEENVFRFYGAASKDNNSAYYNAKNAPMPRDFETVRLRDGQINDHGYLVQKGPFEIDSTYTRVLGGTTRHWEGKALRMLPDDFRMHSLFGHGRDWPISYETLEPYYRQAEAELGVSGDVEDQLYGGLTFGEEGYVLPMHKMPASYLDQVLARDIDGMTVDVADQSFSLKVRTTPQARNGIPNKAYAGGKGFVPNGAVSVDQAEMGGRCQGNTNCVPICPVQAKYDARRTLMLAIATGNVKLLARSVASKVLVDSASGEITGIEVKTYQDPDQPGFTARVFRARTYVLAANAVENARLMLASGLPGQNDLMGRNLMDHGYLLTWALMPEPIGVMRGPVCTSGIEDLRTGNYRSNMAAVRFSIHNDGWGWATGGPYSDLYDAVDRQNLFGAELRQGLIDTVARQVLIDCMIEIPADPGNRVTVDSRYTDQLGNMRPVISFEIPQYTLETVAFSRGLTKQLYQRAGAQDHSSYDPMAPGWVTHNGEGYVVRGGNHWAGTHLMGESPKDSVVNDRQQSWEHANLYLAGAGSMPTIGTANTTLTLAAICLRTAEDIAARLVAPTAASALGA
ncbi:GMC family oxidoreductase [Pararhizobium antarcticum]|uniref:Dehydrogenase n=1 Tax=Pararhizobium antarcticum TaxID=1798805 RepID=A0A657LQ23_9HYPH|nr:GMC family oxidoreductase [Pararhizobium antarcticum]OJF92959.1 dehydrogenase [Pararhizobium antarcticum]OJF98171.1 dehydrogenase [Rhizobium sp. 58]